jgi:hypothetical protein
MEIFSKFPPNGNDIDSFAQRTYRSEQQKAALQLQECPP